jgi:hypothetical protein
MTRRYVSERRKRPREVAAIDANSRCVVCQQPFLALGGLKVFFENDRRSPGRCCSPVCLAAFRKRGAC